MRRALLPALALVLASCASGSGRVETLSQAPSFTAKILALSAPRGPDESKGLALTRELTRRLNAGGIKTADLEESDSVLAGAALGLDIANDPRVLAEIRRATDADGIVFVTVDPGWRSLDVSVLDAITGDSVLRATARPRGVAFASPEDAAESAAEALSALAPERAKAAAAASDGTDEIPVP